MIIFKLTGETIKVTELTEQQTGRCFELLTTFYDNVTRERFFNDLEEKKWIILLRDEEQKIQGFSTQMLIELTAAGSPCKGIFSGDTIIHKDYWGDLELAKIWGKFVFSLLNKYPGFEFYWFLISKGYKTYKFLPAYFKTFFPRYNMKTPEFEKKLIDTFGFTKFPDSYNPDAGVIQLNGKKDYLKPNIADITKKQLKNPHIAFFAEKNPGYYLGDELVCIAKISPGNMKPIVHRYFLKGLS